MQSSALHPSPRSTKFELFNSLKSHWKVFGAPFAALVGGGRRGCEAVLRWVLTGHLAFLGLLTSLPVVSMAVPFWGYIKGS